MYAILGCEPTRVAPTATCTSSAHCPADGSHFCDLVSKTCKTCTGSSCGTTTADASSDDGSAADTTAADTTAVDTTAVADSGTSVDVGTIDGASVDATSADTVASCNHAAQCVGAAMPTWKLEDVQPKSAQYKQVYGLSGFVGKVTVLALLSGW